MRLYQSLAHARRDLIAVARGLSAYTLLPVGLDLIDRIDGLEGYRHLHSARADLLRRLGRRGEAADAYQRALELAAQPAERTFLDRRLAEVRSSA